MCARHTWSCMLGALHVCRDVRCALGYAHIGLCQFAICPQDLLPGAAALRAQHGEHLPQHVVDEAMVSWFRPGGDPAQRQPPWPQLMLSGGVHPTLPAHVEMQQQVAQSAVSMQAAHADCMVFAAPIAAATVVQAAPERAHGAAPPACPQAGASCGPQNVGLTLASAAAPLASGTRVTAQMPRFNMDGVVRVVNQPDVEGLVGRRRLAQHLGTRQVRSQGPVVSICIPLPATPAAFTCSHGFIINALKGLCMEIECSYGMQGCRLLMEWLWHVERVGSSQNEYLPLGLGHHDPVLKTIVSEVASAYQAMPQHPYSQRAVLQSIRNCPLLDQVPIALAARPCRGSRSAWAVPVAAR
jgi:hypothetical protein